MKAKLYQENGEPKGEIDLPESVFAAAVNEAVLHQVIKSYQANARQGTAKTKTRAEVSGSGHKPWRQKGTGRARAGSNRSPIWVRGGKAFGAVPRDYTTVIPRKLKKIALVSALSSRAADEKIMVIENLVCNEPKTKTLVDVFVNMGTYAKKTLLVIDNENSRNAYLSARNLRDLDVRPVSEINALDVMNNECIIFGGSGLLGTIEEAVKK